MHWNIQMSNCSAVVYVLKISNINTLFRYISRDVRLNWDLLVCNLYISCIYLLICMNLTWVQGLHVVFMRCLGRSWYLMIRGHWLISMHSYLLYLEHNLQRIVFLSIVWCHLSNVSVVFLDVCFQQWCHVEHVCTNCQLTLHGWPKYCSFLLLTSASKRHVGFSSPGVGSVYRPTDSHHPYVHYTSVSNVFSLLLSAF